jgi:hypothetical protein
VRDERPRTEHAVPEPRGGASMSLVIRDLAGSLKQPRHDLTEVGRRGEGLAAAQQAVDLRRELVQVNGDAYHPTSLRR